MDWHLKSISRKSHASDHRFSVGDAVVSYLLEDAVGEIARADVLRGEAGEFSPPGKVLGRWEQVLRDYDDEAEARREALRTTEGLFLSLFEPEAGDVSMGDGGEAGKPGVSAAVDPVGAPGGEAVQQGSSQAGVLKALLAAALERKRVIKPLNTPSSRRPQRFLHPSSGREFEIPAVEMTPEAVLRIREQIWSLL